MRKMHQHKFCFHYLPVAVMMMVSAASWGQTVKTATGNVVDERGEPMIGVTVTTTSETPPRGIVTDIDGNFQLNNVKLGEVLRFTFVGMKELEKAFQGEPMKLVMTEDAFTMDEVLVVAYGEQKRSAFTGSASVMSSEQIALRPVTNVMSALEGVTPGIQVQTTSGAPGATSTFRIRGASSISAGKDPLIVVDGVPYESGLNNINPNDVESVTILKDAASTAIYGARGGNGVILITTRKTSGKTEDVIVKFDAKYAISKKRNTDIYDIVKDPGEYYERHYNAMYNYYQNVMGYNSSAANDAANLVWTKNSDEGGLGYLVYTVPENQKLIGTNGRLNPNATLGRLIDSGDGNVYFQYPDSWINETYKTGLRQDYTLSLNGGTAKISVLATIGYTKEEGITDASGYERFTGRIKASFNAKSWLRLRGNLDLANSETNSNTDYENNSNNIFSNANRVAPIYPVYIRDANGNIMYDENGKVYDYGDGTYNNGISRPINTGSNRIQEAILQTRNTESVKTGAQVASDIFFVPELTGTFSAAYDERDRRYKTTGQPFYGTSNPGGTVSVYSYKNESLNLQQLLNYTKSFGQHTLKATVLHEWYRYKYYYLYANKSNMYSYFQNQELAGAITLNDANSYTREYQSEGYGGRVLYDYKGTYHFDASFRRDASSRFHPNHRWGNFYSFGAAYLISKESYFNVPWVNELKVKFSIGQNGNDQIGSTYNRYEDSYDIENANGEIALTFNTRGNKNITWETRTAINLGVEFELFKGRLRGGIEYYNNKTTDMLASVSVPYSLGYSSYWANVGSMRNSGIEIDLRGDIIKMRDFKWSMYFNTSMNKSKILKLAKERTGETLYNAKGNVVAQGYSSGSYFYGEGLEYKTWRLKKFAGVNENGLSTWYVRDDSGELTTTTTYSSASYFDCGSSQPKMLGGFGGSVGWKSLELTFGFSYRIGGYGYDSGYATLMTAPYNGRTGYNYHKDSYKSWTPEKPSTDFARWQYDDRYFTSASDRWLTKADYLNFQNITLTYALPLDFTRKFGVARTIVSAGIDNIFYLSKRKGFVSSRDFDGDIDLGYYPEITRVMFNLSLTF